MGSAELFTDINSAWGMVSDPTKRAELDRSKSIRNVGPVSDSVDLSEFTSSEPGVFTKSCRCGDIYEVGISSFSYLVLLVTGVLVQVFQTELDEGVNCIECNGCSLHVTINLN